LIKTQKRAVERAEKMADKLQEGKIYTIKQIMRLWKTDNSKTANQWIRNMTTYGIMNYFKQKSVPPEGGRATLCTYTFERII